MRLVSRLVLFPIIVLLFHGFAAAQATGDATPVCDPAGPCVPPTVRETVTVTTTPLPLRLDSPTLATVVSRQQVTALPLNGRTFISLVSLAPGVALPPGQQLPRINGGRPRTNEYLFDGVAVLQPEPGQVPFFPIPDAIEAFAVITNSPPAEFGRFNGGVVNLITRSGTNGAHGTAFAFGRHEALNARNWFQSAGGGGAKPGFRRGQFGGVLGGPMRRDRAFFFVDYQGQRQSIARTMISTVPTLLQRQGVFTEPTSGGTPVIYDPATTAIVTGGVTRQPFANGMIPPERIDAHAPLLLGRFPLPTSEGTANNYRRTANEHVDQDQFDGRADIQTQADRAAVRLSHVREAVDPVTPLPDGSGASTRVAGPQETRAWALAAQHQRMMGTTVVNELRVGDTRRAVRRHGLAVPIVQIAGYQQLGSPPSTESDSATRVVHVADAVTWQRGRHTFKAGLDWRWQSLDIVQPPAPYGAYQFTSLFTDLPGAAGTGHPVASFLLGQVQTFSIDLQTETIRNRAHSQEYFVQDTWRLSDRWTVSPGLRYTLNFPSTEKNNQAAVFDLQTQRLQFLGRDGHPRSARRLHWTDAGPRLGISGRLTDRLVAGAGYALVRIEQSGITTPFTTPAFPFVQTISLRSLDNVTPAFTLENGVRVEPVPLTSDAGLGQGVFAVDRNLGSGYVQQWNVSAQRALARGASIEVAYAGSRIARLGVPDVNLNQLTVEQLALGPALLERVPNPYVGVVPASSSLGGPTITRAQLLKPFPQYTTVSLYRHNTGRSQYHGLTARLEQRVTRELSYLVSYTRSRLMDDASSVFDASVLTGPVANFPVADSFNRAAERDVSTGDIPHVFVASVVWNATDRWTLTGIATLQSGTPVAVTQATNFNAFAGFGTQRPHLVGNPNLPSDERRPERWFNTSAFSVTPAFTLGTSSRNPVRGPAYRNVDVAVIRRIPMARVTLEARAEVFNALNTPAFGNPNGVLGTASFGSITTAGDPRVVQVAMKMVF